MEVTIDNEQRLYVIPSHNAKGKVIGYSCLGFDVAFERASKVATWANAFAEAHAVEGWQSIEEPTRALVGTQEAYSQYLDAMKRAGTLSLRLRLRCDAELTPELRGKEGRRVEVEDAHGEIRRFWVGRSGGWMPCHLEIARRDSSGGTAVFGVPFKRVTVVR